VLHFASVFAQKGLTAQLKAPAACPAKRPSMGVSRCAASCSTDHLCAFASLNLLAVLNKFSEQQHATTTRAVSIHKRYPVFRTKSLQTFAVS